MTKVKDLLNGKGQMKLIINTECLLQLGKTTGLVYAKIVELDGSDKTIRENGHIRVSRKYIKKYLPLSLSAIDRAIEDLKLLGLLKTKKASNSENLYSLNYKKAKEVFVDKTKKLESLKELKKKDPSNPWGYDERESELINVDENVEVCDDFEEVMAEWGLN